MDQNEVLKVKHYTTHYLNQIKSKWWILPGMYAYFLAIYALDAGLLAYFVFLAGMNFGGFCSASEETYEKSGLVFQVTLYFLLSFPGFVIVWANLRAIDWERTFLLLIVGFLFLCTSILFARQAYVDRAASTTLRMSVLFGPVLAGVLTGTGAMLLALIYFEIAAKVLFQIAIMFMIISLGSLLVSVLCLVLAPGPTGTTLPPRRKAG